jgi:hypothetical protein
MKDYTKKKKSLLILEKYIIILLKKSKLNYTLLNNTPNIFLIN